MCFLNVYSYRDNFCVGKKFGYTRADKGRNTFTWQKAFLYNHVFKRTTGRKIVKAILNVSSLLSLQ
jgi:hypothetical protein